MNKSSDQLRAKPSLITGRTQIKCRITYSRSQEEKWMSTGQISRQGFQGNNQTYFLNTRIFRETSKETWSQKNQANHECSQAPLQRTPEWDT
jgi:hypothetical protein